LRNEKANAKALLIMINVKTRKRSELRLFETIKARAHRLKRDIVALYLAAKHPRTPWYARALVLCIVAYALSPIDLIPDFVPLLGLVDDLLLLPLGIYIAINLTPTAVITDCRQRAAAMDYKLSKSWIAAAVIISIWMAAVAAVGFYVWHIFYESANPAVFLGSCAVVCHNFTHSGPGVLKSS
jgi:uncharacterized membrane protein YkvA (DUF1232 family)